MNSESLYPEFLWGRKALQTPTLPNQPQHPPDVPFQGPSGRWFVFSSKHGRVVPAPNPNQANQGQPPKLQVPKVNPTNESEESPRRFELGDVVNAPDSVGTIQNIYPDAKGIMIYEVEFPDGMWAEYLEEDLEPFNEDFERPQHRKQEPDAGDVATVVVTENAFIREVNRKFPGLGPTAKHWFDSLAPVDRGKFASAEEAVQAFGEDYLDLGDEEAPKQKEGFGKKYFQDIKTGDERARIGQQLKSMPIKQMTKLNGGKMGSKLVELEDGSLAIFKPASGERGFGFNIKVGSYYLREVAASKIAEILGLDDLVPKVEEREYEGNIGSIHQYINDDAKLGIDLLGYKEWDAFGNSKDLARGMVFDYLTQNGDRHPSNWLIKNGKPVLIDNGLSLPYGPESLNRHFVNEVSRRGLSVPEEVGTWQEKWPELEKALKECRIEPEAIKHFRDRWEKVLGSGGGKLANLLGIR